MTDEPKPSEITSDEKKETSAENKPATPAASPTPPATESKPAAAPDTSPASPAPAAQPPAEPKVESAAAPASQPATEAKSESAAVSAPAAPAPTESKADSSPSVAEAKEAPKDVPRAGTVIPPSAAPQAVPEKAAVDAASAPQPAAAPSGQKCPNCGNRNRPGVLICENCGTLLTPGKATVADTRDLRELQEAEAAASGVSIGAQEISAVQSAGTVSFTEDMILRIEIEGGPTPILLHPEPREMTIGRRDPTTGAMPDVDLTPYAGYRMGVSRRHVALQLKENRLDAWDLGSSNGTYLNGVRMTAYQPQPLRDGDEIRVGQMVLRVYFQRDTARGKN